MIYSGYENNWRRLNALCVMTRSVYRTTEGSDFRSRIINHGELLPFDPVGFDTMEDERCLAELVAAWAVITLDSLVNLALAVSIESSEEIVQAIDLGKARDCGIEISSAAKSEISKKLSILAIKCSADECEEILELCNELGFLRNDIVHDKPWELSDRGEEGVVITEYPWRYPRRNDVLHVENLLEVLGKCDRVQEHVVSVQPGVDQATGGNKFTSMFNGSSRSS